MAGASQGSARTTQQGRRMVNYCAEIYAHARTDSGLMSLQLYSTLKECGATDSETASESERSKGCGASSGVGESGLGRKSSESAHGTL